MNEENDHRHWRGYRVLLALVAPLVCSGCLGMGIPMPVHYTATVPAELDVTAMSQALSESGAVLVLPEWFRYRMARVNYRGSSNRREASGWMFGPPLVVAREDLHGVRELIHSWSGWDSYDVMNHEGPRRPEFVSAIAIDEAGNAVRVNWSAGPVVVASEDWEEVEAACVGSMFKGALLKMLRAGLSGQFVRDSPDVERLTGRGHANAVGEKADLEEAIEFVSAISVAETPDQCDVWRAAP